MPPTRWCSTIFNAGSTATSKATYDTTTTPDVVLFTGLGMFRGHDGVRANARMLAHYLEHPSYDITNYLSDSETAFIEWTTAGEGPQVCDGADSFVVRDGRIVVQTIHYTVRGEPDAARRHARSVAEADREQPPHRLGQDIDGSHPH